MYAEADAKDLVAVEPSVLEATKASEALEFDPEPRVLELKLKRPLES
jgi:hypothetical protein